MELRKKLALTGYAIGCFASVAFIAFPETFPVWLRIVGWLYASAALSQGGIVPILAIMHQNRRGS
jgi:hypothetical protein